MIVRVHVRWAHWPLGTHGAHAYLAKVQARLRRIVDEVNPDAVRSAISRELRMAIAAWHDSHPGDPIEDLHAVLEDGGTKDVIRP